ncbi:MAG: GspH/FimT family pseudopilin [Rubrivivax sp.]|nr:GspH/FimT family pseudopilin [Rubrivivax sp.]
MHPTQGLTLIELMMALAVVAILAAMAAPSFGSQVNRQRLKAAAEGLAADLAEARFEAARRGQALHVGFNGGADWCYTIATVSACDCRTAQPCQLKTVRSADLPGVQLLQAADTSFDTQGASPAPGIALWQSARGEQLRVASTSMGRARICAPAGPVSGHPAC